MEGIEKEIYYDKKIKKISLELVEFEGIPCIELRDWTGEKDKTLVRFHIKEAIELKSMIDALTFGYLFTKLEEV